MNEYEALRAEILNEYDAVHQYNGILYTVAVTLLAFGIERQSFMLCLLPYFVIIPLHFLCEDKFDMMCKIGAYLHVFLEGDNYRWERRKHSIDSIDTHRETKVNRFIKSSKWKIHSQMYITCLICSFLATFNVVRTLDTSNSSTPVIIFELITIGTVTLIGIIIIYRSTVDFYSRRAYYIEKWSNFKKSETSTHSK